jgi:HK97 family phage portal protein
MKGGNRLKFSERIQAALSAFRGKQPQSEAIQNPFFYTFSVGHSGASDPRINTEQLRNFSQTPIVRRAVDYIRNQVSRLAWDIDPIGNQKLTKQQLKKVQLAKNVLRNPNFDDNWVSWIGQMVEDLLVIGMAASEKKPFSQPDHPYLLFPVDSASIKIYLDWDGTPSKPRYAQEDLHGKVIDFKNSDLLVMKHNPRSSTPFGLSPVEVCIQQIQYFLNAQAYAGATASNATPKKLLNLGKDISQQQLMEFRTYFKNEIEGRSHMPIFGGVEGIQSVELGLASDQALFLTWQSFLISIIAAAFNLDSMKFNDYVGVNRSTGDTLDDISDEGAIRPMSHTLEHYINQQILPLFGIDEFAEFKFRFTTSYQDRKSLAVIHQIYAQADVLTINEMRREVGLPDLPYSDVIGASKGSLTLSEYRAIFGGFVSLQDAVGVDEDTGTSGMQKLQEERNKTTNELKEKEIGLKYAKPNDPNNNGNNGVYGAPQPKEKAMNQRSDHGTDIGL